MFGRKNLDKLIVIGAALMTLQPVVPIEGEVNDSESNVSYCQSCMNRDEGRCLNNGLTRQFPSGRCGNYEPKPAEGLDDYNQLFGPVPEGIDSRSTPIITRRPDLEYIEVDFAA